MAASYCYLHQEFHAIFSEYGDLKCSVTGERV